MTVELEEIERLQTLIDLAKLMREAQRDYFRTRSKDDLVRAKVLEKRFDEATK